MKLIGVFAFVGLLSLVACNRAQPNNEPAKPTAEPVQSVAIGRYTIIHSPQVERDTMLIDTATGKTWQLVKTGKTDDDSLAWQEVNRIGGVVSNADQPAWEDFGKNTLAPTSSQGAH